MLTVFQGLGRYIVILTVTFTMTESEGVDAVEELIKTYNELNSPCITELDEEPSPLEFMRFVARNTPFVIRGGAAEWTATQTWSAEFLEKHLKEETVNVAVTPLGYVLPLYTIDIYLLLLLFQSSRAKQEHSAYSPRSTTATPTLPLYTKTVTSSSPNPGKKTSPSPTSFAT